jgi:hypothetical protein
VSAGAAQGTCQATDPAAGQEALAARIKTLKRNADVKIDERSLKKALS